MRDFQPILFVQALAGMVDQIQIQRPRRVQHAALASEAGLDGVQTVQDVAWRKRGRDLRHRVHIGRIGRVRPGRAGPGGGGGQHGQTRRIQSAQSGLDRLQRSASAGWKIGAERDIYGRIIHVQTDIFRG